MLNSVELLNYWVLINFFMRHFQKKNLLRGDSPKIPPTATYSRCLLIRWSMTSCAVHLTSLTKWCRANWRTIACNTFAKLLSVRFADWQRKHFYRHSVPVGSDRYLCVNKLWFSSGLCPCFCVCQCRQTSQSLFRLFASLFNFLITLFSDSK